MGVNKEVISKGEGVELLCDSSSLLLLLDSLVKQLVPLGFTRSDIRKELYLSEGSNNAAALKLSSQQGEGEMESFSSCEGTGEGDIVETGEKKEEGGKVFVIESMQVSL